VDDATLLARVEASLGCCYEVIAGGTEGSRLLRLDGVTAAIVPAASQRSFCNAVLYDRPQALKAALDDLAAEYEAAGVRAWTVWVRPGDGDSAALLEAAGHGLDATPQAMGMELGTFEQRASDECEIVVVDDVGPLTAINDAAYGYDGDFDRTLRSYSGPGTVYEAHVGGRPAAALMAYDRDGDCGIFFVATLAEARGRGLATELMKRALADARDRGCTTTTLQATKAGEPIYARLGYRALGRLEMWERRSDDP
jgi:ribosomal protein S18 acetylase RimI-like enzyme